MQDYLYKNILKSHVPIIEPNQIQNCCVQKLLLPL